MFFRPPRLLRLWRAFAFPCLAVLGLALASSLAAVPATDGLYATFTVKRGSTTVGQFTCSLNHQLAPRTVANFVGLASGERGWMDFKKGGVSRRPFYDGITFHRVVAGFVIQGGSPNGLGTDGPGYTFKDEFHPSLRHSKAGILSMANSGLNSNGSQFFVTLAATSHLDDVHSVFGEVVENMSVVNAVQQGDVIESVVITRVGAAAQAFDVQAQLLPTVVDARPTLVKNGSNFSLNYSQSDDAEYFAFHSGNLTTWQQISGREFYIAPPAPSPKDVSSLTTGQSQRYFIVTKAQYAEPLHTPATVTGKRIVMNDQSLSALHWNFTTATTGSFRLNEFTDLPMSSFIWSQEAYRARFQGAISGSGLTLGGSPVTTASISLSFTSSVTGNYKGSLIAANQQQFQLSGTFTVESLP